MNTTSFMDKQIMDLNQGVGVGGGTSVPQSHAQTKDFIDLIAPSTANLYPKQQQVEDENHHIADDQKSRSPNEMNRDDIVPSYDFQPIRSIFGSGGAASKSGTSDLKSSTSSPAIGKYGSLDSLESSKVVLEKAKGQHTFDATIVSEIDQTLKKHTDNLLNVLEGVSARLTQLESRTHHLENAVDDLKVSVGNNHGITDGKMRHLENILREVLAGVQILKDKQDIVEGQLQMAKSQVPEVDQKSDNHIPVHMGPAHQAASAPQQSQQQLPTPVNLPYSLPAIPPPQPPSQQATPLIQLPNQLPQNQVPSIPQCEPYLMGHGQTHDAINQQIPTLSQQPSIPHREPYLMGHGQTQDAINQQIPPFQLSSMTHRETYLMGHGQTQDAINQQNPPLSQQSHALPRAPSPQQYQPASPPQYSQPLPHPPQQTPSLPPLNASHPPSGHYTEEAPYVSPQNYPPNVRQSTSQPPSGPPPSQQLYGTPQNVYETLPGRSRSGYNAPPGAAEQYLYGGVSSYGNNPANKPPQFSSPAMTHSAGGGYPQIPAARILPKALPTVVSVGSGTSSGSGGPGNRVPIDDVVDKVTSMGFPRDHARATVQRLTENGQTVDLNVVLDKLMNEGEVQPPRGWIGR